MIEEFSGALGSPSEEYWYEEHYVCTYKKQDSFLLQFTSARERLLYPLGSHYILCPYCPAFIPELEIVSFLAFQAKVIIP